MLIVDDNARNAKLARDVLERGRDANAVGRRPARRRSRSRATHRPDLVLMDLRLPDLDGGEAARRLAAESATARIPVVAFSALSRRRGRHGSVEAGFAGYIEKPIDVLEFAGAGAPVLRRALTAKASLCRNGVLGPLDERPSVPRSST